MFVCLFIVGSQANAQLTANFTADSTRGCPPFVVQFTDLSSGNPTSYQWDLGNGNVSSQQNPSTIYFNPGTYTVKLTIRNASGIDSIVKNQYIFVSEVPVVNFTASDNYGCNPLFVQFADASTAGSGTIAGWQWDFGDGATSTQQSPDHLYTLTGNFTVTLRVTNSNGCVTTKTASPFIHVDPSPSADFTSASTSNCNPPVTINFSNTTVGAFSGSNWTFGDGGSSTLDNPSHTYISAGSYPVSLIVINSYGCADTVTRAVVVGSVSPDFNAPDTACQGSPVVFTNTSSGTVSSTWDFGDGNSATAINPSHIFTSTGTYSVKLVNNFGACSDSITKSITIISGPSADFTFGSPSATCKAPVTFTFTSTSAGATSYNWFFGDGGTSSSPNPSHTYTSIGSYNVTLVVRNAAGCTDTVRKSNAINIVPPEIIGFNNLPLKGCVPQTKTFSATIISSDSVTSYLWNLGDGTTSNLPTPTHTYSTPGIFNVYLKITTASGCTDTFTYRGAVIVGTKPHANFVAFPLSACASQPISFTDLSTGTVNNWAWNFGDNTSSGAQNPNHLYNDTGFFTITLVVGNYYCYDTLIVNNYIYIKPPTARFDVQASCDSPYFRKFINRSKGAVTSTWYFGDGNTSNTISPIHMYATPGIYYVRLVTTADTCSNERRDTIYVIDQHPGITSDSIACRNSPVTFFATNIDTSFTQFYKWVFGDGTPDGFTTVPKITRSYSSTGLFHPILVTIDLNGCRDTAIHPGIHIVGPKAAFSNPEGTCLGSPTLFTNQSIASGSPISQYIWRYGDLFSDTLTSPPFSHTYQDTGRYSVRLIVVDSFGCRDTVGKTNGVVVARPLVDFRLSDTISCRNTPITFINKSTGINLTYAWNFGDGGTSNLKSPTHTYLTNGPYLISLKVSDKYGCTDSTIRQAITVHDAVANFAISDTTIFCPPAQLTFYNLSQYYLSLKWDFDDGSFSSIDSPAHFFSQARTYNVKLIAYGHGNCVDSIVKPLKVKGPSGSFSYSPLLKCYPATVNFTATATNTQYYTWDFADGTTTVTTNPTISHTYDSLGQYVPKLLLQDTTANCTVPIKGTDTISVTGVIANIKATTVAYCDSAVIHFFDSSKVQLDSIASYLWTFGDGGTSPIKNPTHTYTAPGLYNVLLYDTTRGGCSDTASIQIKVLASPQIAISGPLQACVNAPVAFAGAVIVADTSTLQWSWVFDNGNTSTLQSPPAQSFSTPGLHIVRLTTNNSIGCIDTASLNVQVYALPNVSAGADTTICLGKTIVLNPSGAQGYVWRPDPTLSCSSCSNPAASPTNPSASYVVEGTSPQGCKNRDSVLVTVVQPFSIQTVPGDTLCRGDHITLTVSGADNYEWDPTAGLNNPFSPNPEARPDTTTTYRVIGHDYKNCFADTAYVPIRVYPVPQFNIEQTVISIPVGNSVTLNTTSSPDVIKWQWTPADGLNCTTCPQPVATPLISTTYQAEAINKGGCTARDQVVIKLTCGGGNLYIPNTFSPNGDGMNDIFYPRGKGIHGIKFFRIFNRWGAVIFTRANFEANDPSAGWDGTYKGQHLSPDVFVFQVDILCEDGAIYTTKGNVTLVR